MEEKSSTNKQIKRTHIEFHVGWHEAQVEAHPAGLVLDAVARLVDRGCGRLRVAGAHRVVVAEPVQLVLSDQRGVASSNMLSRAKWWVLASEFSTLFLSYSFTLYIWNVSFVNKRIIFANRSASK